MAYNYIHILNINRKKISANLVCIHIYINAVTVWTQKETINGLSFRYCSFTIGLLSYTVWFN